MPKSHERVAQEREARKARIADAAIGLFATHGFSAVSVEQIAEACGYTRVSVYNHFRGKPMIYLYLVERGCARLAAEIEARVGEARTTVEAYGAFLACLIEAVEQQPSFFELYFLERESVQRDMSEEETRALEEAHLRVERPSRALFERGVVAGDYRDVEPAVATNLFFASFAGAILLYRTHRFRANLRQLLEAVGHYFLRGLQAPGAPYLLPTRELPPELAAEATRAPPVA